MARRAELVVAAAGVECAQFAIAFGADAVCLTQRAALSDRDLAYLARFTHDWGKKLYLTIKGAGHTISGLPGALHRAKSAGVDALVLSDLGVLRLAASYVPELPVHYAINAAEAGNAMVYALQEQGVARVVLANELTLPEIKDIRLNTTRSLELEALALGELVAELPRWHLLDGQPRPEGGPPPTHIFRKKTVNGTPEQSFEVEDLPGGSVLSANQSLCALGFMDRLLDAGAGCVRVDAYYGPGDFGYTAGATAAAREALDTALAARTGGYALPEFAAEELVRVQRKPWTTGFYFGGQSFQKPPRPERPIEDWRPIGLIEQQAGELLYCRLRGEYRLGTPLEALAPPGYVLAYTPPGLWQGDGAPATQVAPPDDRFILAAPQGEELPAGTVLRVRVEAARGARNT